MRVSEVLTGDWLHRGRAAISFSFYDQSNLVYAYQDMTVCMQRLYQEMFPHQLASRADKENLSVLDDLVPPLPPSVSPTSHIKIMNHRRSQKYLYACLYTCVPIDIAV